MAAEAAGEKLGKTIDDVINENLQAAMDRLVAAGPTCEPLGIFTDSTPKATISGVGEPMEFTEPLGNPPAPCRDWVSESIRTSALVAMNPFADELPAADLAKMFRVKVILHSESPEGVPLVTWRITAPRVILAEINTHRALSRSSESSRAIPAANRIAQVKEKPYRPLRYGARVKGMGAGDDLTAEKQRLAAGAFDAARRACIAAAEVMNEADLAKEELNRVLEPWALCRTVLTGTDWSNFYALRTHEAAHPAFRFLARAMWVAQRRSVATRLDYGQWHLPFITPVDRLRTTEYQFAAWCRIERNGSGRPHDLIDWESYHLARWSAARCARTSFGAFGKTPTPSLDDATWAKLVSDPDPSHASVVIPEKFRVNFDGYMADPLHASPLEHQGAPFHPAQRQMHPEYRSNLRGWVQFRKLFVGENLTRFEPPDDVVNEWELAIPPEVFDGPDLY